MTYRHAGMSAILAVFTFHVPGAWAQIPPAQVDVATVEVRELAPTMQAAGSVVSVNDVIVSTEIEGIITWLADVGTRVEQGDPLARLDDELAQLAVRQARASVSRLEAEQRFRDQQLKRSEELAATQHVSATLLDEARSQRDMVAADLEHARVALARAEREQARTTVRSPFSGHVVQRAAGVGQYVRVADDLVRLVDTQNKELSVAAPIDVARFLTATTPVQVRAAGEDLLLPVRSIVPVGDMASRMLEIRIDASQSPWMVATAVSVQLPVGPVRRMPAIPRDAIVERSGQRFFYRVLDGANVERVDLQNPVIVGLWVGVADGVSQGDQVVVRGAERLTPGQNITLDSQADP